VKGTKPSRRKLVLLIGGLSVVIAAGLIATAFTPTLATKHPLLLITLDARNRMLILARRVDVVPFVVVGTLRRLTSDPLYWLLGYWYGDRAIRWLEKNGGGGPLVVWTEKYFAKAAYPIVFFFPGAVVCALAGATGMPFPAFLAVNVAGTITAVIAVRLSSGLFAAPVDAILGFFNDHLVETTAATIGLVVLSVVLNRWMGNSEIPSVTELEAAVAEDVGETEAGDGDPIVEPAEPTEEGTP
jgi:membrane protein DedA with SNARE-associated domain